MQHPQYSTLPYTCIHYDVITSKCKYKIEACAQASLLRGRTCVACTGTCVTWGACASAMRVSAPRRATSSRTLVSSCARSIKHHHRHHLPASVMARSRHAHSKGLLLLVLRTAQCRSDWPQAQAPAVNPIVRDRSCGIENRRCSGLELHFYFLGCITTTHMALQCLFR